MTVFIGEETLDPIALASIARAFESLKRDKNLDPKFVAGASERAEMLRERSQEWRDEYEDDIARGYSDEWGAL